jgi:hypothetical protein
MSRFKIKNRYYFDLLQKRLDELDGKLIIEDLNKDVCFDGLFVYYLARISGLKSKKKRHIRKRGKFMLEDAIELGIKEFNDKN